MQLLVNIDHVATLRNARGEGYPSPVKAAEVCERAGASGIVFHLRKDRRHVRDEDVYALKKMVRGTLDFEMAATREMMNMCREIAPDIITLVPESREELTTEGGLNMQALFDDFQSRVFPKMANTNIALSLFVDPNQRDIELACELGADAIELHTGTYANACSEASRKAELDRLKIAAMLAYDLDLKVNAGHGLNLNNITAFVDQVPHLNDVSIGHALVATAVFKGLEKTVKEFLEIMRKVES